MRNQQIILSNKFIAERTSSSKKVRKNNRQMWAYSNSKMLDKFGNAEREKCRIDNKFCLLSIKSDRVAEWLRRWTANPIRFPCVSSNPISVGILLGTDRKWKHDVIQATHFKQQNHCLEYKTSIWKKKRNKLTKVSTLQYEDVGQT